MDATNIRMGIAQNMLTIREKETVRDIEYRHTDRMTNGVSALEDPNSAIDGDTLNRLGDIVSKREAAGITPEIMEVVRMIQRAGRDLTVADLATLGAGNVKIVRRKVATLVNAGVLAESGSRPEFYSVA